MLAFDTFLAFLWAFPVSSVVKNPPAHVRKRKRCGFDPWIDPLEEKLATHSSILAGNSHGKRSLAGYNS